MKTAVIVLAAGASTRMGHPKQLLPYKNTTLLAYTLQQGLNSKALATICVLGANAEMIKENLTQNSIFITTNPNWLQGLGSSIAHAVNYIEENFKTAEAILFTLADQPFVSAVYLNKIIASAKKPDHIYASAYQDGIGVPALFPKLYFEDLKALHGSQGAKQIILNYKTKLVGISPDFENIDIDTPNDYKKL